MSYTYNIDALNAICVANGGAGGHTYNINALNEWLQLLAGTGGSEIDARLNIEMLNEIAAQYGAQSNFTYNIDALNAIASALGASSSASYVIDALNAINDILAPYHADAVHFDGSALHINSLTSTENAFSSLVFWIRAASFPVNGIVCVADPETLYTNYVQIFPDENKIAYNVASGDASAFVEADSSATLFSADTWFCIIATADANHPAGQKIIKVYNGDTEVAATVADTNSAFDVGTNGKSFWLGDDSFGSGFAFDMADFRFMPGISLLTAGDISQETRRLFIDDAGKPVNPTVATAALGPPAILFSGDSAAFPINQGNGGTFTLDGLLTNASTSPSD